MSPPVRTLYSRLLDAYGPQHWWPAETQFQILAGAVLVQNTRWENVERALTRLREAGIESTGDVLALPVPVLEALLQPAGTYRVKALRLRALCAFIEKAGGVTALTALPLPELRARLIAVHGIGFETADALLVYLFGKPAFVVDAYARRLFERLGRNDARAAYDVLRGNVEAEFAGSAAEYNELHALIVEHGKRHCRKVPVCEVCSLRDTCNFGMNGQDQGISVID